MSKENKRDGFCIEEKKEKGGRLIGHSVLVNVRSRSLHCVCERAVRERFFLRQRRADMDYA